MAVVKFKAPSMKERPGFLRDKRNAKMARSAHAYMRGNTIKFYEWLETKAGRSVPQGPSIWICGDCHIGNLGPVANLAGRVDLQIRDLDQTVIGNPAHDLIRLGLSLATAARSADLPGITTALMIEEMVGGYTSALNPGKPRPVEKRSKSKTIDAILSLALRRRWKQLADERIEDTTPTIPRGERFWDLTKPEQAELRQLVNSKELRALVTGMWHRPDDADIDLLDAAYWVKGCSSLGRLRYAVLVGVTGGRSEDSQLCLLDIKEATTAAAPRDADARMPRDNAVRVVTGAQHLSPNLGDRMLAARMMDRSVFIRELLPQDLKLEISRLTQHEAVEAARYLSKVVGIAHARQLGAKDCTAWRDTLLRSNTQTLDAPSWLWRSVVDLVASHEAGYLEHCRQYPATA